MTTAEQLATAYTEPCVELIVAATVRCRSREHCDWEGWMMWVFEDNSELYVVGNDVLTRRGKDDDRL